MTKKTVNPWIHKFELWKHLSQPSTFNFSKNRKVFPNFHIVWSNLMSQRSNVTEIKCSDCGKAATVPFKPTAGKPVYCRECLAKHSTPKGTEHKGSADSNEKQAWSRRRTDWK